jgi:hypothetical protein
MLVEPSWPGAEKAHFADYFLVLVFFHQSFRGSWDAVAGKFILIL